MGGQKLAQQQYAQQQYADQYNQAMSMIGAGQQNKASSLGALGQFGMIKSIYGGQGNNNNPTLASLGLPDPNSFQKFDFSKFGGRTTPYDPQDVINAGGRVYPSDTPSNYPGPRRRF